MDEWIKDNPLENVDFIKVDVEGYELEVLKGSENTIKSFKPVIFIEIAKNFYLEILSIKIISPL